MNLTRKYQFVVYNIISPNLNPTHDEKLQRNRIQLAKRLKPQITNPHSHTQPNTFPLPLKLPS